MLIGFFYYSVFNWLIFSLFYCGVFGAESGEGVIFGDTISTSKYPIAEDAYAALNLIALNIFVVYFMYSLRQDLRQAYRENLSINDQQKETNWMMSRTLEIDGTVP